jgi:hypothetical protein
MKQHINFATQLPKRIIRPLQTKQIAVINVAFIIMLIAFSLYANGQNNTLRMQLNHIELKQQISAIELERLSDEFPKVISGEEAAEQLAKIAQKIEAKKKIIALLSSQKSVLNTEGFSSYFTLFAQNTNANIQLTNIHISNGGGKIRLAGNATSSDNVLHYMQRLNNDFLFENQPLHLIDITQPNPTSKTQQFVLYSQNQEIS